jgi:hypothetical protein
MKIAKKFGLEIYAATGRVSVGFETECDSVSRNGGANTDGIE